MASEGTRQGLAFLAPLPQKSASAARILDARPSEATFPSHDTGGALGKEAPVMRHQDGARRCRSLPSGSSR
jgi:hypothetical protein